MPKLKLKSSVHRLNSLVFKKPVILTFVLHKLVNRQLLLDLRKLGLSMHYQLYEFFMAAVQTAHMFLGYPIGRNVNQMLQKAYVYSMWLQWTCWGYMVLPYCFLALFLGQLDSQSARGL